MVETDFLKNSIIEDAKAEAAKIVAEAEKTAAQKKSLADGQIKNIVNEAARKAEEQSASIQQAAKFAMELTLRKGILKARDDLLTAVLDKVRAALAGLVEKASYRDLLRLLLTEGAAGLAGDTVVYNASERELAIIDDALLNDAAREAKALVGLTVRFVRSGEKPLLSQGVRLSSEDGRLVYNNQIDTRLRRLNGEIRTVIAKELYD